MCTNKYNLFVGVHVNSLMDCVQIHVCTIYGMQIHNYVYVCISITNHHPGEWCQRGGAGEGAPDSSPQDQPDAVSPPSGLGEDDDDPLLEEGEVDMRAMLVAGGMMEFELLKLPPQSKTEGPWTFQQVGWGRVVCI